MKGYFFSCIYCTLPLQTKIYQEIFTKAQKIGSNVVINHSLHLEMTLFLHILISE